VSNESPAQALTGNQALLQVEDLRTTIPVDEGTIVPVDGVSFTLNDGETLGVVGESGCGKSVTAQSILRIVPQPSTVEGRILLRMRDGSVVDVAALNATGDAVRKVRGREAAMIFQEPMSSFSPIHKIGFQIAEAIGIHRSHDRDEQRRITLELLDWVGIPQPDRVIDAYPMQLSGGMRQRAMIAMALSCEPQLLIADEPTTALDVTVQAQVLLLLKRLQRETGMAIMFITHNLGVIAEMAERVAVMYLGQIVEYTSVDRLFFDPKHPYTQLLLKSIPKVGRKARVRLDSITGTVPIPIDLPDACYFIDRCPFAMKGVCDAARPDLYDIGEGHQVRCYLYRPEGDGE
jgi:oligopeptide/dipeptide ABC transporter ATP-binding protein